MPRVWNKRERGIPRDAVYVGRPGKWGNPFTHLKTKTTAEYYVPTRRAAIAAYAEWLLQDERAGLLASIKSELRGKDLVCWCAPHPCHADVLLLIANDMIRAVQHIPNFVDGVEPKGALVETQEELLAVPWIAAWADKPPYPNDPEWGSFHRWSLSDRKRLLMAEFNEGRKWWVVAKLSGSVTRLTLPDWVPVEKD